MPRSRVFWVAASLLLLVFLSVHVSEATESSPQGSEVDLNGDTVPKRVGHMNCPGGAGVCHIGIFVAVCVFLTGIFGIAGWGFLQNRADAQISGDETESYFLASKSFGVLVLLLTVFSTAFSGFTVVGDPLESGWIGLGRAGKNLVTMASIGIGMTFCAPVIRAVGNGKKHYLRGSGGSLS